MEIHDVIPPQQQVRSTSRRNLLKFALIGGSAFFLGRFFPFAASGSGRTVTSPYDLWGKRPEPVTDANGLKDFKFVETDTELRLYTKEGEEIFVVDKESM